MVPKYPLERGEGYKAGGAIDVEQAFDFCHADIVTEFRSIAIIIPPGFFQGIRALKGESYPLKFTKSHFFDTGTLFHPPTGDPAEALLVLAFPMIYVLAGS